MEGDTSNPCQVTQHPQMGGDTSDPKILILMTQQKLSTLQGDEILQTPTSGDRQTYRGLQQVYPTNTQ